MRTVASALQRLKALGILNWVRRCAESWQDGRFVLEQGPTPTRCCRRASGAATGRHQSRQRPCQARWGDPPPMLSAVAQAGLEGTLAGKVHVLAADPKDRLAAALARLGRAFMGRELVRFTGVHQMRRNLPQS